MISIVSLFKYQTSYKQDYNFWLAQKDESDLPACRQVIKSEGAEVH